MNLHFEPNLDDPLQAIETDCDLCREQEICRAEFAVTGDPADRQMYLRLAEGDPEQTLLDSVEHLKDDRSKADVLDERLLKRGRDPCVPIETRGISKLQSL